MIDTVKFKIPLTPLILAAITRKPKTVINSPEYGMKIFTALTVPPLNNTLSVFKDYEPKFKDKLKDPHGIYFYLEGSLPKLEYGENINLLYPSQVVPLLRRIEIALIDQYGDVPHWELWEVQRIDICYAWKFSHREEAMRVLEFLKTLEYKGKNKYEHKTSLSFGSRTFNPKFYLKEPEFKRYGYKELVADNREYYAKQVEELSKGVLRYEVRVNKPHFITLFKKKNMYGKDLVGLDTQWYYQLLNEKLFELLRNNNSFSISDEQAIITLMDSYKKQKADRLFLLWKVFYLQESHIKKLIKKYFSSSTLLRDFTDIKNAGVGIPHINNSLPFDLSIPSKYVVTPEPEAPFAPATEQREEPVQESFCEILKEE